MNEFQTVMLMMFIAGVILTLSSFLKNPYDFSNWFYIFHDLERFAGFILYAIPTIFFIFSISGHKKHKSSAR